MEPLVADRAAELQRLRIARDQRPTGAGRGWLLLSILVGLISLIAVAAAVWYYRESGRNIVAALTMPSVDVNLMTVPDSAGATRAVALVATGKIVSDRQVNVATKVSGQIVELNVEQGDRVDANQVLARVEDVIYRAQRDEAAAAVARTRYEIERAEAEHVRAKATVVQAQAEFEFERRNFDRLERLHQIGQASDLEFLDAKNRFEAAAAALDVANASVVSTASAIDMIRAQLAANDAILRVVQKRLDDCDIRAPIGGVILERNAQVGDFLAFEGGRGANANAQLVSIADMTLLRVEIDVSERDIHRVSAGQPCRVTPDADRARAYEGRVMWVDPIGDYAKASVQVKVRILEPGPELRVQGSAKVEFLVGEPVDPAGAASRPATIWLPKAAVKLAAGGDDGLVFTVKDNRAVAHPVKIGARAEKMVEIRSGVRPGMQLLAGGLDDVKEGTTVRITRTVSPEEL